MELSDNSDVKLLSTKEMEISVDQKISNYLEDGTTKVVSRTINE